MSVSESSATATTVRERVRFYLIDHRTPVGKAVDIALLVLNLAFIGIFVVETYAASEQFDAELWTLEVAIASVFLAEYVLRLYSAPNRLAEFLDAYTLADLVSILPTFAILLSPGVPPTATTLGLLRIARVARVLRFFRFTKDQEFFFGTVSVETLRVMKLLLTVLTIFFSYAGLFFTVEHAANPAVRNFGDAFYFSVVSLTTVGFGDITPVTEAGRWVTVAAIFAGIILIPWEASRIVREWTHKEKVNVTCPNCGLSYHDPDASHCKSCGNVIYQEFDSRR